MANIFLSFTLWLISSAYLFNWIKAKTKKNMYRKNMVDLLIKKIRFYRSGEVSISFFPNWYYKKKSIFLIWIFAMIYIWSINDLKRYDEMVGYKPYFISFVYGWLNDFIVGVRKKKKRKLCQPCLMIDELIKYAHLLSFFFLQ